MSARAGVEPCVASPGFEFWLVAYDEVGDGVLALGHLEPRLVGVCEDHVPRLEGDGRRIVRRLLDRVRPSHPGQDGASGAGQAKLDGCSADDGERQKEHRSQNTADDRHARPKASTCWFRARRVGPGRSWWPRVTMTNERTRLEARQGQIVRQNCYVWTGPVLSRASAFLIVRHLFSTITTLFLNNAVVTLSLTL